MSNWVLARLRDEQPRREEGYSKAKITGRRNYSDKWVIGADSVHSSNIKNHAHTDQHAHAMLLLKKEHAVSAGVGPSSYTPIAKSFSALSDDSKAKLTIKFDIAHFLPRRSWHYKIPTYL